MFASIPKSFCAGVIVIWSLNNISPFMCMSDCIVTVMN